MATVVNIGRDKVLREEGRLIIHAVEVMDWPVREFCRLPIYFEGEKYYVRSQREGTRPYKAVYELWRWPADLHEPNRNAIVYDHEYVAMRNQASASGRGQDRLHGMLLPLYPFLGLLWSRLKNRLIVRAGFDIGSVTKASIALTFNLFLLEAVFVGWLGGGLLLYFVGEPGLRVVDWALMVVLGADAVMRFAQSLQFDVENHWGFCEWIWRGK